MAAIPRGIEVLVKKASVDPEFRQLLLARRGEAAGEIDLELTDTERNILSSMPAEQLEKIIDNTKVEPEHRAVFLGKAAKLMLVAVAGIGVMSVTCAKTTRISPDGDRKMQIEHSDDIPDANDPNVTDLNKQNIPRGMTADRPPESGRK